MINVIIYLKKEQNPMELVKQLLTKKLIAKASIDFDNHSYKLADNESDFIEETYSVVTAQTRSVLFNDIVSFVETEFGPTVPINSVPIVASNKMFDTIIRQNTNFSHTSKQND
jgi:hypothetical protein